jgi:hypothetical protein
VEDLIVGGPPPEDLAAVNAAADGESPQEDPRMATIKQELSALVQHYQTSDSADRLNRLQEIQKCLLYWHGEPNVYWDPANNRWLSAYDAYQQNLLDEDDVKELTDVNTYRPMLESLIAAATVEIPKINFFPKKANDPTDISTARAASKTSTYLDVLNDAQRLIQEAHFTIHNQHFVAGYTFFDNDKKYGLIREPIKEQVPVMQQSEICPECMAPTEQEPFADNMGLYKQCPNCRQLVEPQPYEEEGLEEQVVGYNEYPKGRVVMQVWGPKNVKLPQNIKKFEETPYIFLEIDTPVGFLADLYPEKADEILALAGQGDEKAERWSRRPVTALEEDRSDSATWRLAWFRPWAFNMIGNKEGRGLVRSEYPDGALVHMVNETFIKGENSDMDDHWEITETPLAETIHDDPTGKLYIPINDMQNDMIALWRDSVLHNIPEVYVDSSLLNRKTYNKVMASPGMRVPVKAKPGQNLSQSFFETRGVTMSRDISEFKSWLEQLGQFTVGALPSIWGGYMQGGSETAHEYESSKQSALQRVALKLGIINAWWARLKLKSVKLFRENGAADEFAVKSGDGYKSFMVSPDELTGELDRAIPEASSAFPTTWFQKRQVYIEALKSGNQMLIGLFHHPENSTLLKQLIGIDELFVPGEQDRLKQLYEISELLKEPPIEMPVMSPMGPTLTKESSIKPDPRTDNGPAHIITLQTWLNSEEGREAQVSNPEGYENVLLHLTEHLMLMGPPPAPTNDVAPPTEGE